MRRSSRSEKSTLRSAARTTCSRASEFGVMKRPLGNNTHSPWRDGAWVIVDGSLRTIDASPRAPAQLTLLGGRHGVVHS